jgi:hypothetical protein
MIPKRKEDVLNVRNTITNYADNTELEIWLSWMHYPIYISMIEIADISKKLKLLELDILILKRKIFKSLKREDYSSIRAMNTVVNVREDVISLKREKFKLECDLTTAKIKLDKFNSRNNVINKRVAVRSNTSDYQENINWTVRNKRR